MNKLLIIAVWLILLAPISGMAQDITFQWDPHPEAAQLQGFKLYQSKQSGNFTTSTATFNGGTTTTGTIPRPGLGRWYFVLTAFTPSPDSLESAFSNEVTVVIKPKAPTGFLGAMAVAISAPVKGVKKIGEWAGLVEHKNLRRVR